MDNYFNDDTILAFQGDSFTFEYVNEQININKVNNGYYAMPKIMYIPAERNLASIIDRPDKLKGIPGALGTFIDEYERAKISTDKNLMLPISGFYIRIDKANRIIHVGSDSHSVRLSDSASGFQSLVPLYLVSKMLGEEIEEGKDLKQSQLSAQEKIRLQNEIEKIMLDTNISEEVRQATLRTISMRHKCESFINIVEEPELNLFPDTQKQVLNELLRLCNLGKYNVIVFTTHSPYLISYLANTIKANDLGVKAIASGMNNKINLVSEIVPQSAWIKKEECRIYYLSNSGDIKQLDTIGGIPSDDNYLNNALAKSNIDFSNLLEIEQQWQ